MGLPAAEGRILAQGLLDLRSLNEHEAGEKGFVRLTPDGNDFLLGDGTRARFWAYNDTDAFLAPDPHKGRAPLTQDPWPIDPARHARFLAKRWHQYGALLHQHHTRRQ